MKVIDPILFDRIFQRRQIFTYSNAMSFARLLLGIFIYYLIRNHQLAAVLVFGIIAVASDFLDGYIARQRNEITEFGKVLDPLADKISIALASIALHQGYGLPLWIVGIIIGRDVLIILGSLLLMNRLKFVVASALPGKIAVTTISSLLASYLFGIEILQVPLQILTLILIVYSSGYYSLKFYQLLRKPVPEEDSLL